jgi:hypothetical protein
MAMTDSNRTEMVVAMVDGNRNSNSRWQRQWQWVTAMATASTMATATGMESATVVEMVTAIAMATAKARATMTKGGLPLHVQAMCSTVAGATHCLHPHRHKGVCIHQRCIMGVMLQKVFAPFSWGGFLTAHHGLFVLFFRSTVQFTEQPSVCPLHYSGAQDPCQPIDALPSPLLFHIFEKVSLGGAWIVCL